MRTIWIDCDPGHDDALAMMVAYAYPENFHILGITTVGGNQTLDKVTINAKNIHIRRIFIFWELQQLGEIKHWIR